EQSIGGGNYTTVAASQAVTSLSAASLTNGTAYSYRVLASLDGTVFGLPSRPVTITPSANPVENVSIAKLSLNQGVEKFIAGQTDSISVPAIQDRTGYLRLYLQAQNPHSQAQKLLVKLYSQRNSQTLTRIEQEVLFRSSDADNEVLNQINIELPEWINKAGTEFYIELGNSRLPSTGTTSFGFVAVPKMQVRLFPLNANGVSIPENEWETYRLELQKYLTAMFPSVGVEVQLAPVPQEYANLVINTVDSWNTELSSFDQLRDTEIEGKPALASVFYYGMFRPTEVDQGGGLAGLANTNIGYPTSNNPPSLSGIGIAYDIKTFVETAAHEIGHNLGRIHVNGVGDGCQFPGPTDESYPHANGVIGKTGLNLLTRQLLASNYYFDIMSYCSRVWISDYNYKAMYDFLTALYQNNNVTASVAKIPPTPGYFMRGLLYADYAEVTGVFAGKGYEFSGNSGLKLRVLNDRQELLEYAVQTIEVDHSDARSWKAFIPESSGLVKAFLYSEEQDRVLWEAEESGLSSNVLASSSLVSPVIRVAEDRYAYYNQEEQNTLLRLSRDGGLTYEVIAMGKIRQTEFNAKAGDLFEVQTSQGLWPQVFQYVLP
ncbi:MAG: hypothetical protein H3C47_01545, partial [Candidatus Cloacimonetes bacterium]|nr:hypothetical protein [Candidatus Cloacimonadota bacterium]